MPSKKQAQKPVIKTKRLADVGLDHSARNWRKVADWFEDYDAKGEDYSFEFFMFDAKFRKSNNAEHLSLKGKHMAEQKPLTIYADQVVFTLGETADAPIEERYSTSLTFDDNRSVYVKFYEQPQHKETILGPLCFGQLPSPQGNRSSYITILDAGETEED